MARVVEADYSSIGTAATGFSASAGRLRDADVAGPLSSVQDALVGDAGDALRRQAEHLEAGGSAEDSPLASLVTHGVTTAAKGGGAAGGSSLLD